MSKKKERYVISRRLGAGAFGTVYLTYLENDASKTAYAVKETYQDMKYNNREKEILSQLSHECIIKIYKMFYSIKKNDKRYLNIVMEYFPLTLYDHITNLSMQNKLLSYLDIKWYTLQLFRAVGYISERLNICHRDIKPQNILVNDKTKIIKLCDFGSAKKLNKYESNKHYICSRFYRAPELLCKSIDYSCSVDLWSLGCCMAEMYLTYPLFNGSNTNNQVKLITSVLGPIPRNFPSSNKNDDVVYNYEKPTLSDWIHILKINENYEKLNYPRNEENDYDDAQFIKSILQYDPNKRLNLKQTLNHIYFKQFVFNTQNDEIKNYPKINWDDYELSILQQIQNEK